METRERIYRSRSNRIIGGVCSGLGNYLNLDPVLIRIIFIVLAIFAGGGILIYIILWIVIPEEPAIVLQSASENAKQKIANENEETGKYVQTEKDVSKKNNSGRVLFGAILIIIGLLFLFKSIFHIFDFEYLGPIILILIGISLLISAYQFKGEK